MAEIIDFNQTKEAFNKEELTNSILDSIGSGNSASMTETLAVLLAMPDKEFELIAPTVIDYFEKGVNNPTDKLLLTQSLNAQGIKAEDLGEALNELLESIDKINTVSVAKKDFLKQMMSTIINAIMDTEGIAKKFVSVAIEKCHPDAIVPQYANTSDSGMDLYALEDYVIAPGETKLIPTGIKIALPPGYELQVRPKSGRALKTKLRVANTPGTIDAGYRDEVKVIIENIEAPIKDISYEFDDDGHIKITSILHGTNQYIGKGEKFAQLVLMEVPKAVFYAVDNVSAIEGDRGGGFGSTGLK